MIALLLSMVIQVGPSQLDQFDVPKGWAKLATSSSGKIELFAQPGTSKGLVWAWYEYAETQTYRTESYRSSVMLVQADCANGRMRLMQVTLYPQPKRSGKGTQVEASDDWLYPEPDTTNASIQREACR